MNGESYYGLGILVGCFVAYLVLQFGGWGILYGAISAASVLLFFGSVIGFQK